MMFTGQFDEVLKETTSMQAVVVQAAKIAGGLEQGDGTEQHEQHYER